MFSSCCFPLLLIFPSLDFCFIRPLTCALWETRSMCQVYFNMLSHSYNLRNDSRSWRQRIGSSGFGHAVVRPSFSALRQMTMTANPIRGIIKRQCDSYDPIILLEPRSPGHIAVAIGVLVSDYFFTWVDIATPSSATRKSEKS